MLDDILDHFSKYSGTYSHLVGIGGLLIILSLCIGIPLVGYLSFEPTPSNLLSNGIATAFMVAIGIPVLCGICYCSAGAYKSYKKEVRVTTDGIQSDNSLEVTNDQIIQNNVVQSSTMMLDKLTEENKILRQQIADSMLQTNKTSQSDSYSSDEVPISIPSSDSTEDIPEDHSVPVPMAQY